MGHWSFKRHKREMITNAFERKCKHGFPCAIPNEEHFKNGDKFTIKGYQLLPDGRTITNCKPGNETIFTARIIA